MIHRRVANFVQLYTQVINYSTFMLVTHRNMISVYNMKKKKGNNNWGDTIHFPLNYGYIRKLFIKKRPKDDRELLHHATLNKNMTTMVDKGKSEVSVFKKYQIVCFAGSHAIKYVSLRHDG